MVGFVEDDESRGLVLGGDMVEVGREDGEGFADHAGAGHRRSGLVDEFLAVGDEEALAGRAGLPAEHDRRSDDGLAGTSRSDDERVDALGQVGQRGGHGGFLIVSEFEFHMRVASPVIDSPVSNTSTKKEELSFPLRYRLDPPFRRVRSPGRSAGG